MSKPPRKGGTGAFISFLLFLFVAMIAFGVAHQPKPCKPSSCSVQTPTPSPAPRPSGSHK